MEQMWILVLCLLAIPISAAVIVALLGPRQGTAIRWVSLLATLADLVLAVVLTINFATLRSNQPTPTETVEDRTLTFHPEFVPGDRVATQQSSRAAAEGASTTSWDLIRFGRGPASTAIQFYVGLDGLNVWLMLLTALLMVSSVLVSWTAIQERVNEYYAWLLTLGTGMVGVFLSFDIILFYVFFELTLVPLFFLIGIWGGLERRYAARKFFIYTLTGSLFTLLGLLGIVLACYHDPRINELTFSIPRLVYLVNHNLHFLNQSPGDFAGEIETWQNIQFWVFLAMMAGFAIKVPLVPLHTWLPLAHVEAPTAGSVLLAGVLLKIGTYGFLRLCLPLAPYAALTVGAPLIGTLAVIGIVYGSFCSLAQADIKKLVAYSSVAHLGFCMLGMFALNLAGLSGSVLQMVNHGLSTGALFLLVGMLYERYHTRMIADYGGLGARLRLLACFMVFICLSSIGLPGLNGFVGEVLILMGSFDFQWSRGQWPVLAVVAATGVVLGAWYLLTMLYRAFFGPVKEPHDASEHGEHQAVGDLNLRELAALVPIALCCLLIGVYPRPILDTIEGDLQVVTHAIAGSQSASVTQPVAATIRGEEVP